MNPIILQIPKLITDYYSLPKKQEEKKEFKVEPIEDIVEIKYETTK